MIALSLISLLFANAHASPVDPYPICAPGQVPAANHPCLPNPADSEDSPATPELVSWVAGEWLFTGNTGCSGNCFPNSYRVAVDPASMTIIFDMGVYGNSGEHCRLIRHGKNLKTTIVSRGISAISASPPLAKDEVMIALTFDDDHYELAHELAPNQPAACQVVLDSYNASTGYAKGGRYFIRKLRDGRAAFPGEGVSSIFEKTANPAFPVR